MKSKVASVAATWLPEGPGWYGDEEAEVGGGGGA